MDEEKLVAAVNAIGDALRTEVFSQIAKLDEKCSALADSMAKMKADADRKMKMIWPARRCRSSTHRAIAGVE